jgi:hypothetical protein
VGIYIRGREEDGRGYAVRTDGGFGVSCKVCLDRLHLHLDTHSYVYDGIADNPHTACCWVECHVDIRVVGQASLEGISTASFVTKREGNKP